MDINTGPAVLVLLIFVLAIMRLTRLVNADRIADFVRLYPAGKIRDATLRAEEASAHLRVAEARAQLIRRGRWATTLEFVQCPWCVGFWFSLIGAYVPVWYIGWPWWATFPVAFATSHLVGVCARFADTEEIEISDGDDD